MQLNEEEQLLVITRLHQVSFLPQHQKSYNMNLPITRHRRSAMYSLMAVQAPFPLRNSNMTHACACICPTSVSFSLVDGNADAALFCIVSPSATTVHNRCQQFINQRPIIARFSPSIAVQVLRPFMLRRTKREVETELPGKTEHILRCDLSAWQQLWYRQIAEEVPPFTLSQSLSMSSMFAAAV